ncbi:MAG: hypothetical protein DME22_04135 [Verrucomicrobia bacterium]|nr:MAG: hypothetical protein DME22_04135 [Verrucomicrobiota bacterium]PYJ95979.1 MAG: hypothetical protein DME23_22145 [Verrucomicrobiota bacterium]
MNRPSSLKSRLWTGASVAVLGALLYALSSVFVPGAGAKAEKKTEKRVEKKPEKKKLSGAELYSMHCNRCHPERYPTERTAAQWKTILLHMRVRANLPAEQSQMILKYLQDNSGR